MTLDGGDTPIAADADFEAALAERGHEGRRGEFRGVTLSLPAKLPGTVALDLAEMQDAQSRGDTMRMLGSMYRFLESVLGSDGVATIREKIAADGDSMDDIGATVSDIVSAITKPYAVTPGESTASATPSGDTGA